MTAKSADSIANIEEVPCDLCAENDAETMYSVTDRYSPERTEHHLVRCRNCSLVYVNPRPTREAISAFYPRQYYSAEVFHESTAPAAFELQQNRRLADIARLVPVGELLDVGCGAGQFLAAARDAGWKTHGIDFSSEAAQHAREYYGLSVTEQDLLSQNLPSDQFDCVTMWGVIEHLHSPNAAVQEVFRILRPGGLYVALLPNIASTQAKVFRANWYLLDVPRHLYHFSPKTFRRMVEGAGLNVLRTKYFAPDHDLPNLALSIQETLYPNGRVPHEVIRAGWTWNRLVLGAARRSAPVLARIMAVCSSSAAMEVHCRKPADTRQHNSASRKDS